MDKQRRSGEKMEVDAMNRISGAIFLFIGIVLGAISMWTATTAFQVSELRLQNDDLRFHQAVDPIAQELIVMAREAGGLQNLRSEICSSYELNILVRPGGYATCSSYAFRVERGKEISSLEEDAVFRKISVRVWSERPSLDDWRDVSPSASKRLLGTVDITTTLEGHVLEVVRHRRI